MPPFHADQKRAFPLRAKELKATVPAANAILIVTPEYNYSIPGVLENAINWASHPYRESAGTAKQLVSWALRSGCPGPPWAQYHLRQIFVFLNMIPLNRPEVIILYATEKFDEDGELTNFHMSEKIPELFEALVDWTRLLKKTRS